MPERFAAVADRLMETCGTRVAITCGPGEEPIARAICAAMKDRTAPSSPRSSPWEGEGVSGSLVFDDPVLSLGELKSLIRRCDLLIGNDAGPRHIAKAFGVPVVTVFGPTHPDWTSTDYEDERIVRIDVDCGPCQQRVCPLGHHQCMTGVTVDAVYEAASELLRSRSHQHVATP
jgi:heptosyltransferase-2